MMVIGVTGSVGTGKSTVARMLGKLGAVVIDADQVAHEVMEPNRPAWRAIVKAFGQGLLQADGTLNRRRLAGRVFRDANARRRLEAIVHPRVIRAVNARLRTLSRNPRVRVVVLDVPLLVEAGMRGLVDTLVVVTATSAVQRRRLRARGYSAREVARRANAQWTLSAKVGLADVVVNNSSGVDQTWRQVKRLWNQRQGTKRRHRG